MLGLTAILTARQPKPTAASTALSQGEAPDSENESVDGPPPTLPPYPPTLAGEPEQSVGITFMVVQVIKPELQGPDAGEGEVKRLSLT